MADGFTFEKERECVQSCSVAESIATFQKVRISYQLSIFDIARRLDVQKLVRFAYFREVWREE